MICNNPIRVKFAIVNVNTVGIRSSQQIVAFRTFQSLLYSKMGNYACSSRFSILKYTKQTSHWTSIRLVIVKKKFILELERQPDHGICPLLRNVKPMKPVRFVHFNEEMVLFSGTE